MAGALIITAELGPEDFGWLERLRRQHYPADRNQVPAHLTIFRALPPSAEAEVRSRLARVSNAPPPGTSIDGIMDFGGGLAFRIVSSELEHIRGDLAEGLQGLLSAQDSGGWRPHITIQNKVPAKTARALKTALEQDFRPRLLKISGLGLYRYANGPWERIAGYPFRA